MSWMVFAARLAACLAAAVLVAACELVPSPAASPNDLEVANGTTLEVWLLVNGRIVDRVPSGEHREIPEGTLGSHPWVVEARTATGRILLRLEVPAPVSGASGRGARADLSCGRLDVFAGAPMMGPAPGPGVPGDCEP